MKTLKPCPFCGQPETKDAKLMFEESQPISPQDEYWCYIACGQCLTEGPAAKSHSAAVRKWNHRSMHNNAEHHARPERT